MSQGNDVVLVRAIVELAVFLEFCPESSLSQDAGIEAMEQLASTLQLMTEAQKQAFTSALPLIASTYSGDQADFVLQMGSALGLE